MANSTSQSQLDVDNQTKIERILALAERGPGINGSDIQVSHGHVNQFTSSIACGSIPLDLLETYLDAAGVLEDFLSLDELDDIDQVTWDSVHHISSAFQEYRFSEDFMNDIQSKTVTGWYDQLEIDGIEVTVGSNAYESDEFIENKFLPNFLSALKRAYPKANVDVCFNKHNNGFEVIATKCNVRQ